MLRRFLVDLASLPSCKVTGMHFREETVVNEFICSGRGVLDFRGH